MGAIVLFTFYDWRVGNMTENIGDLGPWCILRTSGARTLPLADSLVSAGIGAWTPRKTIRRVMPRGRVIEAEAPILPTMVFARAVHLMDLVISAADPALPYAAFSVFRHAGKIPLVRDRDIAGLQVEERAQAELLQILRDCETREERRRERAAAMKTKRARRKLLRSERIDYPVGLEVGVKGMPAMAGLTGVIETTDGKSAVVAFGGSLRMTIEAWQILPADINVRDVAA
jgi:hypothetical protein